MNRTTVRLLLVGLLLILGIGAVYLLNPTPKAIHLQLTGTTGAPVKGDCVIDGKSQLIDGSLPLDIKVSGRDFEYSVELAADVGKVSGAVIVDGIRMGHSEAQSPQAGVRGHYTKTLLSESVGFTTFTKGTK
jgi:hypothetical protein